MIITRERVYVYKFVMILSHNLIKSLSLLYKVLLNKSVFINDVIQVVLKSNILFSDCIQYLYILYAIYVINKFLLFIKSFFSRFPITMCLYFISSFNIPPITPHIFRILGHSYKRCFIFCMFWHRGHLFEISLFHFDIRCLFDRMLHRILYLNSANFLSFNFHIFLRYISFQ